jgi:hypothetical protein
MHALLAHYPAIKRNKLLPHATTWLNLKGIMLNEKLVSQPHEESQLLGKLK